MHPARRRSDTPNTRFPPQHPSLSLADNQVRLRVDGKLGFACWKAIAEARQVAAAKHMPLCVEVGDCREADMAGIGSLLVAIDRLGSIAVAGCTERSHYWFSNFGICSACTAGAACPRRTH